MDVRNARGATALMLAAERGHTAIVQALLEAGADVHAENAVGETAWVLTATLKQEETEAALKAAGAKVDLDKMVEHFTRLEDLSKALRDGSIAKVRDLVESGTVDKIADDIEAELYTSGRLEMPSAIIGDMVMEKLKALDHIAYIRFASVYRDFTDITTLKREVDTLLDGEVSPPPGQLPLLPEEELTAGTRGRRKRQR